jgi:hypothetical protein
MYESSEAGAGEEAASEPEADKTDVQEGEVVDDTKDAKEGK